LEQQDLNKRLLLALALSFLVFVGYSYLFPPQTSQPVAKQNASANAASASIANKATPGTNTPVTQQAVKKAPATTASDANLATVVSHSK